MLTKCLLLSFRDEMVRSFSHFGDARKQSDYQRTKQDFYRMELDR